MQRLLGIGPGLAPLCDFALAAGDITNSTVLPNIPEASDGGESLT